MYKVTIKEPIVSPGLEVEATFDDSNTLTDVCKKIKSLVDVILSERDDEYTRLFKSLNRYKYSHSCDRLSRYKILENEKSQSPISDLISLLKEDKSPGSYYYSWQSNIAMTLYDVINNSGILMFENKRDLKERVLLDDTKLRKICNDSARLFLDIFIGDAYDGEADGMSAYQIALNRIVNNE